MRTRHPVKLATRGAVCAAGCGPHLPAGVPARAAVSRAARSGVLADFHAALAVVLAADGVSKSRQASAMRASERDVAFRRNARLGIVWISPKFTRQSPGT